MIDGIGTPFGFDIPNKKTQSPAKANTGQGNILFTTTEAFAGATVEAGSFASESLEFFNIPGLSGGGLVAFPINGNSMEPVIHDGDLVVCQEINGLSDIKDNKIYAVKNNGSIWVKYVQRIANLKGRISHLKLISANHLEYDPFVEEVNQYTRLYRVIRRISDL